MLNEKTSFDVAPSFSLEIESGLVVGDYGAIVTPGGVLDYETSEYFGLSGWREHPLFLRRRLPPIESVEGTVVAMAARGGSNNYFHFLLDVLPRFGVFEETMPGRRPDALYVPTGTGYQRMFLELAGLSGYRIIPAGRDRAVRAERLVVPSLPNRMEVAPSATVAWLRSRLRPLNLEDKPRRIYITRGVQPNTRRLVREAETMELLERRGFVRVDPGKLSAQEQIDTFAAAEVIVAPHGAALTNLLFLSPGARVLELFAPSYVNQCFWAITQGIAEVRHQYLVADGAERHGPGDPMNKIQADIHLDPTAIAAAVDALIAD
ncbi:MAG: glycosyltransferase family 61 protein [Aeromicrobium sp.]